MTGMVEKIYSQALFDLGIEGDSLDTLKDELFQLSALFEQEPGLIKLLSAPTVTMGEKFALLERVFKDRLSQTMYNFLCVLTEKNRTRYLVRISQAFKEKYYAHSGMVEISVTTAAPMKDTLRDKLLVKLEQITGKKVTLVEKTDPTLLGGIVLHYGNTEMNASVKARLEAVHAQMKAVIA